MLSLNFIKQISQGFSGDSLELDLVGEGLVGADLAGEGLAWEVLVGDGLVGDGLVGDGLVGDANRLFFWILSTDRSIFLLESSTVKSSENFLGIIFRPDLLTTKSLSGGTHSSSS